VKRRSQTPAEHERPALVGTVEVFGHDVRRCQWWKRSTGRQCRKAAMDGGDYCKTHGGNRIQIGPANPNWRHGRWSRLLPQRLQPTSPSVLDHIAAIHVLDGRIEATLRAIAEGGTGSGSDLRATYARMTTAMQTADSDGLRAALLDLRDLIEGAAAQQALLRELDALFVKRARLVDAERRIRLSAHDTMNRAEAAAHARALVDAVTRHIRDRAVLVAILRDIRPLIAEGDAD
jgi:hypothetical protein